MVKSHKWTGILFNLIPLVDDEDYKKISFEQMKDALDNEKVFELLEQTFNEKVDFSLYTEEDRKEMCEELSDI